MKTSLLILTASTLGALGAPQVTEKWAAHLDLSSYDQMVGLGLDARGNIYVAGHTAGTNGLAWPDLPLGWVVAKYAPSGSNLWEVRSPAADTTAARSFTVDAAGQCYVTGWVEEASGQQLFIAAISAAGERRWERRHVPTADLTYSSGRVVQTDAAGQVWVGGAVITNNVGFIYEVAALLLKYDSAGKPIRAQVEVLPNVVETAGIAGLAVDPSGALLARIPGYATNAGWEAFVVKFSPAADLLWIHETDVIDLSSFGNYPLAGPVSDAHGNVFLTGPVLNTDFLIKVIKLDSSGQPLWHARYGALYGGGSDVSAIAVEPDGSVIVTGIAGTAYIPDDFYARDIVTLKYGADGTFRWLSRGNTPRSGSFIHGRRLALDGRGNTYVGGEGWADQSQRSELMKLNRRGQREWLISQQPGPGPGLVAGVGVGRRGVILGGSDYIASGRPVDLHVVNYKENSSLAAPRFLDKVKTRVHDRVVVLEAKAVGRGPLQYQWFRDGLPVGSEQGRAPATIPTQSIPQLIGSSRKLKIQNVPANTGEYYVEVSNAHGSAVSEVVRVGLPSLDAVPGL